MAHDTTDLLRDLLRDWLNKADDCLLVSSTEDIPQEVRDLNELTAYLALQRVCTRLEQSLSAKGVLKPYATAQ